MKIKTFFSLLSLLFFFTNKGYVQTDSSQTKDTLINLVPVFGIEVINKKISLSEEHCNFKWLSFKKAHDKLTWDGQKKGLKAVHSMLNLKDARMKWSKII